MSFVSAFIRFDICVGLDSLAFVGMDMINGSSANLILYVYILFQLWKLCVFFLGLIGNGISCFWLNQVVEFGIIVLFCVLGYLNYRISLICRTCGDERFHG